MHGRSPFGADAQRKAAVARGGTAPANVYKRDNFPWCHEVLRCAPQEAMRDLERAFRNFSELVDSPLHEERRPRRQPPNPIPSQRARVGADLGLSSFAVLSDGTKVASPKALERSLRRLRRLFRALSR